VFQVIGCQGIDDSNKGPIGLYDIKASPSVEAVGAVGDLGRQAQKVCASLSGLLGKLAHHFRTVSLAAVSRHNACWPNVQGLEGLALKLDLSEATENRTVDLIFRGQDQRGSPFPHPFIEKGKHGWMVAVCVTIAGKGSR
jgi:hypothetical protein